MFYQCLRVMEGKWWRTRQVIDFRALHKVVSHSVCQVLDLEQEQVCSTSSNFQKSYSKSSTKLEIKSKRSEKTWKSKSKKTLKKIKYLSKKTRNTQSTRTNYKSTKIRLRVYKTSILRLLQSVIKLLDRAKLFIIW
jgi:hypothetical protein